MTRPRTTAHPRDVCTPEGSSMMSSPFTRLIAAVALLAFGTAPRANAQQLAGTPVWQDSLVVTPGAHYRAGSFARFLFGDTYRSLWMTPIKVPVLSLERFAGG